MGDTDPLKRYDPSFQELDMMFGWVRFPVEKRVQLFRRALLEVIKGWRLLAQTASTRSMSEFCAAVRILLRVLHVILYPT